MKGTMIAGNIITGQCRMLLGFHEEEVRLGLQSAGRLLVHYAQNPGYHIPTNAHTGYASECF